ncbi:MAG: DDE-type integrase/transposase/recombinase [Cyanobacteriota/Melainabacteria group bacterium]
MKSGLATSLTSKQLKDGCICLFIDLFSRMVVGWSMSDRLTADIALDAFEMGKQKQQRAPVVVHSDRGSQYACNDFRKLQSRKAAFKA